MTTNRPADPLDAFIFGDTTDGNATQVDADLFADAPADPGPADRGPDPLADAFDPLDYFRDSPDPFEHPDHLAGLDDGAAAARVDAGPAAPAPTGPAPGTPDPDSGAR